MIQAVRDIRFMFLAMLVVGVMFSLFLNVQPAHAAHDGNPLCSQEWSDANGNGTVEPSELTTKDSILGIQSWDRWLHCDSVDDSRVVNFNFPSDIWLIALACIEIVTRFAVLLAVGLVIFAGFKFIIAQGNAEKIAEAKTIIENALIGLAISVLATVIVVFIGNVIV